jgi:hypothetical protein
MTSRVLGDHQSRVDLLVVEGAPDLLLGAVAAFDDRIGRARLAGIHLGQVFLAGFAAGAELGEVEEHVGELRLRAFLQVVLEEDRLARDVVDHEVHHQVEIRPDALHVLPGAEGRVHAVVGQGGEPPVGGGGVEGQEVQSPDGVRQVAPQEVVELHQVAPQAVGIGDQLDLVAQGPVRGHGASGSLAGGE